MAEVSRWKEIERHMKRSLKSGWKLYSQSKYGMAGLILLILFLIMAIFAPWLTPYTPDFEAPPQDALKAYLYAFDSTEPIRDMAIGYTQLFQPNQNTGGDWLILDNGETIRGVFVQNPAYTGGGGGNKSLSTIAPWETTNYTFTLHLSEVPGLSPDESIAKVIYASPSTSDLQYHYSGIGQNPYYDGELIFITQKHLVIYDMYNFLNSSYNRYKVISLGFTPTWVVEDVTSAGELTTPVLYQHSLSVYPMRFIMVGNDHHLLLYYHYYTYSNDSLMPPIDNCVKLVLNTTYSEKILYTPLLFFTDSFQDNDIVNDQNVIVVPLEDKTLMYKGFDKKFMYPVPIPGLPPVQVTPKIVVTQFNFTLTAPPAFYSRAQDLRSNPIFLPVQDNGIAKFYVTIPRGESTGHVTINEKLTLSLGNGVIRAPAQVTQAGGNLTVYATKYIPESHTSYLYRFKGTIGKGFALEPFEKKTKGGTETVNAIPIKNAEVTKLIYVAENNQLFFLTKSMELMILDFHQYLAGGYVEIGPFSYYLKKTGERGVFPYPSGSKLNKFVYVGSLLGTRYKATASSIDIFGGYYSNNNTVGLVLLKGENILPLPPGKYPSGNFYFLGTDDKGHDIWTWLVYGSRVAFIVGILAAFTQVVIGTLYGVLSGYRGGLTDTLMMRFADIMLTIPFLPIILILTSILGPSIWNIIMVIGIFGWAGISRVIRAQTLSLKSRPFVDAARVAGASRARIMISHILPNVLPFAFLYMTLGVAGAILTEAALSFLGLGDPHAISWGQMLYSIQTAGATMYAWWWLLPPGLSITLISLGFYLIGRAFDEILNPRLRKR